MHTKYLTVARETFSFIEAIGLRLAVTSNTQKALTLEKPMIKKEITHNRHKPDGIPIYCNLAILIRSFRQRCRHIREVLLNVVHV